MSELVSPFSLVLFSGILPQFYNTCVQNHEIMFDLALTCWFRLLPTVWSLKADQGPAAL